MGICPNQHWPPVASETSGMTELQPSERPAHPSEQGWLTGGTRLRIGRLAAALSNGAHRLVFCNPSTTAASRRPKKNKHGERHRLFSSRRCPRLAHFLWFVSSIGLAWPNRGNLSGCEDVYWLSAADDRNAPPPKKIPLAAPSPLPPSLPPSDWYAFG